MLNRAPWALQFHSAQAPKDDMPYVFSYFDRLDRGTSIVRTGSGLSVVGISSRP
jgi:hypothetical protein